MSLSSPGRNDVLLNGLSFAIFAAGSLAANFVVARVYGPATTGLFNQVLALYIVASQLAVFGLHLAALREASLLDPTERGGTSNLIGVSLVALVPPVITTVGLSIVFSLFIPSFFETPNLQVSWLLAVPGLALFALNKVLINLAVGFRHFRFYAFAQGSRSVFFLSFCALWIISGQPGETLALTLGLSELLLTACLLPLLIIRHGVRLPEDWPVRVRKLMRFGTQAMPSVAFADFNSRIDIIVLGLFVAPETIGVYTIAAWLIEGSLQLPVAVRPLINSRLTKVSEEGHSRQLANLVKFVGSLTALAMLLLLSIVCLVYPFLAEFLLSDPRYKEALVPLIILSAGLIVASYYLPFDLLLSQAGHPWAHSRFKGAVLLTNLALALLLVPLWGMIGAALAYGLSFVFYAILLRVMARRILGFSI